MIARLFLDLDGTVYLEGRIIASADVELRRIAEDGAVIHYMTNNTSISTEQYLLKLKKLGLPVSRYSIISPTVVLANWLISQKLRRAFVVGTKVFCDELRARVGISLTDERAECVIVAFDRELSYSKLETACRLINAGTPWYITHIDLACPSSFGPVPDCGAIGRLLEATTGIAPIGHFGKPGTLMLNYLRERIGPDDQTFVVGDRLYTDAEVGLQLGARTIVVCSGEFRLGTIEVDSRIEVHPSLTEFLKVEFPR